MVELFFIARGELLGWIFVYIIKLVKTVKIYGGIIMKRTALIVIALAFALTGCANVEGEKEASPISTETIVSTDNAPAQNPETDNGTAENVTEIFDVLNTLEYQPYTCDGLPEYLLTATDGTVYSINFSEKWIWRGNSEQAELSDELIARLKEDKNLTQAENVPVETNTPKELKRTVESISTLFEENGYYTKCENTENFILSGEQYVLFLDKDFDKLISIYVYETTDDAQADAKSVNQDGYSTDSIVCIDWISTPHFFLCDNLILQYTGTDKTILAILTDLCGEQFAGGDVAEGALPTTFLEAVDTSK